MSMFRAAARELLERNLVCPGCDEANSETHRQIELDAELERAYCQTCSRSGPIADFQPLKEKNTDVA